jgi:cation transport ATPase
MKSLNRILAIIVLSALCKTGLAQSSAKHSQVVYIQTSAICEECQSTIEGAAKSLKGVKQAALNMTDKKLMVKYSPKKISDMEIKNAISLSGYDADEVRANAAAYEKLPKCCQQGNENLH